MNSSPLHGLIAATISPFHDHGLVNLDAIGPMLDRLIEIGISLKAMMEMLGMPAGACRLPLRALTTGEAKALRKRLNEIGYFEWCGIDAAKGGTTS